MTFVSRCLRLGLGALLCSAPLYAQVTATAPAESGSEALQRFDLFGGAAYSHFNPGYAHQVHATNLLGWQGSATAWLSRAVGAEGGARGFYGNTDLPPQAAAQGLAGSEPISEHVFLFGPSFRMLRTEKYTAGMHVLVGGAYGNFDKAFAGKGVQPFAVGIYNTQLAFASAIGGWADYKLGPRLGVRFIADYQPTRYGNTTQNEFAGSVGVVYRMGSRGGK
ncbi:MAG TPA: hypothetical protein VGD62_10000 [Acidobacteriaceae bacterium]